MKKTVTSTFSVSAVKDGDKGENGKTTHFAYLYIGNSVAQENSTFTLSETTVLAWTYDKETVIAKRLSAGTYTASNALFGGDPYPGLTKTAYFATFSTEMFAGAEYCGTYDDTNVEDSNDPSLYTWGRIKGDEGDKGEKGDTGSTGPVMYNAGTWSSTTQYINNGKATPMVMTESSSGGITSRNYWYLPNVGSSTNQDPRNGAPWEEVPGYAALFAEMAIINGGTLNDAVFKDGWMFSKAGRYMSNESYVYTTYNDTNWTNFDPTVYNSSDEASWRPLVAIDFRNGKAYYTDSINATGGEFQGSFSAYKKRVWLGRLGYSDIPDKELYGIRFMDASNNVCGIFQQYVDGRSNASQASVDLQAYYNYADSSREEVGSLLIAPTFGIEHSARSGYRKDAKVWSIDEYGVCDGLKQNTEYFPISLGARYNIDPTNSGTFYLFDNDNELIINLPEDPTEGYWFEFKAINHPINLKVKNNSHSIVFQDEAQSNRKEQRIEDSVPRKYIYAQGRWFEMSYHH